MQQIASQNSQSSGSQPQTPRTNSSRNSNQRTICKEGRSKMIKLGKSIQYLSQPTTNNQKVNQKIHFKEDRKQFTGNQNEKPYQTSGFQKASSLKVEEFYDNPKKIVLPNLSNNCIKALYGPVDDADLSDLYPVAEFSPIKEIPNTEEEKHGIDASQIEDIKLQDVGMPISNRRTEQEIFESMQDELHPLVSLEVMMALIPSKWENARRIIEERMKIIEQREEPVEDDENIHFEDKEEIIEEDEKDEQSNYSQPAVNAKPITDLALFQQAYSFQSARLKSQPSIPDGHLPQKCIQQSQQTVQNKESRTPKLSNNKRHKRKDSDAKVSRGRALEHDRLQTVFKLKKDTSLQNE